MNNKRIILYCLLICFLIPMLTDAKIVFKSYRDGSRSLYVMDDDGSNLQRLTASPGLWPAWSPDGKQIAFNAKPPEVPLWPQIYAIYIINSDGTGEHRLTDEVAVDSHPTWSPNGKDIAFNSNRPSKPGEAVSDIWWINIATKELRRLTRMADWRITHPRWSPDGEYIAYQRGVDIYLMRPDGRGRHNKIGKGTWPEWSPDSQSVVCMEEGHDALGKLLTHKVVIISIKTGKRQVLETPDDIVIHTICFMGNKYVLISLRPWDKEKRHGSKYDIYSYHLVTGEMVNLTNTPAVDDFFMDWISDDVLPVSPKGKITVTWGKLKQ